MSPCLKYNARKAVATFIVCAFAATSIHTPVFAQSVDPMPRMPTPGVMVHLSPEFTPALLKGIVIHPENALQFDFIVYKGDEPLIDSQKRQEYTKLIKYFLASLAVPDEDQWVNLSPYENNRIIKDDFGKTEMGRDLLAQDYILKQITASLIYPEDHLGREFWDRVYVQAQKQYGTTNIPVNTFNKVWIVPDGATIYQKDNIAYVLRHHLKVMLEEDYLSLQKHSGMNMTAGTNKTHSIASKIVKEIVIPALEKEVNTAKNFSALRQVYSGMILAAWYKRALKESLLAKVYANQSKLKGIDQDPKVNQLIYQQYLKAYKKGVFNFIREDTDKYTNESIPRKYFSGGTVGDGAMFSAGEVKYTQSGEDAAAVAEDLSGDESASVKVDTAMAAEDEETRQELGAHFSREDIDLLIRNSQMERALRIFKRQGENLQQRLDEIKKILEEKDFSMTTTPSGIHAVDIAVVYNDKQALYNNLPLEISNLIEIIAKSHGFAIADTETNIAGLINKLGQIYGRMGLTTNNYHNHLHQMIVTRAALTLAEQNGLIHTKRDLIVTVLGALFHDFHVRAVRPEGSSLASDAYVNETLGTVEDGQYKGGQLPDLLGIKAYAQPAIDNARYASMVTAEDKAGIQALFHAIIGGNDAGEIYNEVSAVIRRTDFKAPPAPVLKVPKITAVAGMVRGSIVNQVDENLTDAGIDDTIRRVNDTVSSEINPRVDSEIAIDQQPKVREWVKRQNGIEVNFLSSLKSVPQERRFNVFQLAQILELADQSGSYWMAGPGVLTDIILGLQNELENVNVQASYPYFFKKQFLEKPNILGRLSQLPFAFRSQLYVNFGYFANYSTAFAKEHDIADPNVKNSLADWEGRKSIVLEILRLSEDAQGHISDAAMMTDWHRTAGTLKNILFIITPFVAAFGYVASNIPEKNMPEPNVRQVTPEIKELPKPSTLISANNGSKGGIDLNAANLDLQIKRDGRGIPLPVSQQDLENIHIDGLVPVILDIKPAIETPLLSELQVSAANT